MTEHHHGLSEEEFQRRMAAYDVRAIEIIAEHGVFLQGVFGDEETPSFIYTVGLYSGMEVPKHPEFIVFGVPFDAGKGYMNDLAIDQVIKKEARFSPGVLPGFWNDGALDGYLLEVTDSREHLTMANRFFGESGPVPALQLFYPDKEGRFPWKEGYDLDPRVQPVLGLPPQ